MVDVTLEALNLEEIAVQDTYVAVRVGETQKLARVAPARNFKFPQSALGERRIGKVDVLKRVGSINIHVKGDKVGASQEIEIPAGFDGSTVKFRVLLDGAADTGKSPPEKPPPKALDAKVLEARSYLTEHNLETRLSEAMQAVLRSKPENPSQFIYEALLRSDSRESPEPPKPTSSRRCSPTRRNLPAIDETSAAPEGNSVPTTSLTSTSEPPPVPGMRPELPPLGHDDEPPTGSLSKSVPMSEPPQKDRPATPLGLDAVPPEGALLKSPLASEVPVIKLAPTRRWNQRPSAAPFVSSAAQHEHLRLQMPGQEAVPSSDGPLIPPFLVQKCVEVVSDECRETVGRGLLLATQNGSLEALVQKLAAESEKAVVTKSLTSSCDELAALVSRASPSDIQTVLACLPDDKRRMIAEAAKPSQGILEDLADLVAQADPADVRAVLAGLTEDRRKSILQAARPTPLASARQASRAPPSKATGDFRCLSAAAWKTIHGSFCTDSPQVQTQPEGASSSVAKAGQNACGAVERLLSFAPLIEEASVSDIADGLRGLTSNDRARLFEACHLEAGQNACGAVERLLSFAPFIEEASVSDIADGLRGLTSNDRTRLFEACHLEADTNAILSSEATMISPRLMQKCVEVARDQCRETVGRGFLLASKNGSLDAVLQKLVAESGTASQDKDQLRKELRQTLMGAAQDGSLLDVLVEKNQSQASHERVAVAGDFRSLPEASWNTLHSSFSQRTPQAHTRNDLSELKAKASKALQEAKAKDQLKNKLLNNLKGEVATTPVKFNFRPSVNPCAMLPVFPYMNKAV